MTTMFAMTKTVGVFCGRSAIHVLPMSFPPTIQAFRLLLVPNMPAESKANPLSVFSVAVDISESGRYVVATDSVKNVYLFEYSMSKAEWRCHATWVMPTRLVKIKIDREEHYVVMIDKTGDIYANLIGLRGVSKTKKLMGHTSLVMDMVLSRDNLSMITCDRDEKIRISSFPMAFQILNYALGHQAAVVNVALLNNDLHMISASADGIVKLWRFGSNGAYDHTPLATWNIFYLIGLSATLSPYTSQTHELVRMKAMDFESRIFVAVFIAGHAEIKVFEIAAANEQSPMLCTMKLVMSEPLDHDVVDMLFLENYLFLHFPELGGIRKYSVQSGQHFQKDYSSLMFDHMTRVDIAAYGASYRPNMAPLMKRPFPLPEPVYPPSPPPSSPPRAPSPLFPYAAQPYFTVPPELALASSEDLKVLAAGGVVGSGVYAGDFPTPYPGAVGVDCPDAAGGNYPGGGNLPGASGTFYTGAAASLYTGADGVAYTGSSESFFPGPPDSGAVGGTHEDGSAGGDFEDEPAERSYECPTGSVNDDEVGRDYEGSARGLSDGIASEGAGIGKGSRRSVSREPPTRQATGAAGGTYAGAARGLRKGIQSEEHLGSEGQIGSDDGIGPGEGGGSRRCVSMEPPPRSLTDSGGGSGSRGRFTVGASRPESGRGRGGSNRGDRRNRRRGTRGLR